MSQTKQEFILEKIGQTIDAIRRREGLTEASLADLGWIKFYAKEMMTKCEACEEAPHGSKIDKDS